MSSNKSFVDMLIRKMVRSENIPEDKENRMSGNELTASVIDKFMEAILESNESEDMKRAIIKKLEEYKNNKEVITDSMDDNNESMDDSLQLDDAESIDDYGKGIGAVTGVMIGGIIGAVLGGIIGVLDDTL